MIRRLLVVAATIVGLACASTAPNTANAVDPREKDPAFRYGRNPGPSPVGAIPDIVLTDATRNARAVKFTIEYPTRGGSHPVIVFSHGGGLSNRSYPGLSSHWASYGYVVIRPAHDDRLQADEMTAETWRDRTRDVTFVIDSLATLPQRFPELEGKMDTARIAVAGHSRGATTAMMIGGLRTFPAGQSLADPRVKAIAVLSPNGPRDDWGITTESWSAIRVPALFMTGSRDTGRNETETPEWRQQAFELSPAGDKWLVTIEGVTHTTFTGQLTVAPQVSQPPPSIIPNDPTRSQREAEQERMQRARGTGMDQRAMFDTIRSLALAFFDAYLKDDAGARQHLEQADSRGNIDVKRK